MMKLILKSIFIVLILCEIVLSQNYLKESTYDDFIDGYFSDGGANMYESGDGQSSYD